MLVGGTEAMFDYIRVQSSGRPVLTQYSALTFRFQIGHLAFVVGTGAIMARRFLVLARRQRHYLAPVSCPHVCFFLLRGR